MARARLFGTDGIRGVANTELTPEFVLGFGRALVRTLREEGVTRPWVAVGRDPRASGEMLEAALLAGLTSAGGDALPLGVLPTPGVAYLTPQVGADAGVMLSASHNPVADNGIKVFGGDGYKLTDAEEERVEELLQRSDQDRPTGASIGRVRAQPGLLERYVAHLVDAVRGRSAAERPLGGLHVVVDCANGAAAAVAPEVLRRLGCQVTALFADPTGDDINAGCGSTHPQALQRAVVEHAADVGLAHDGDADRLVAVDATGALVDGDQILAILARRLQSEDGLAAVVTTVMTNLGFRRAMEALGIEVVQTKVGDRYVLEAMRAHDHPLGGEQSGHVILAQHATTGDGVLTGVLLLDTIASSRRTLADLAAVMTRLPQVLLNVPRVDRNALADADVVWKAVAEEEALLGDGGRVLVRPSGTEPLVRVMVEAPTAAEAELVAGRIAAVVDGALGVT